MTEVLILLVEAIEIGRGGLDERGDGDGLRSAQGNVAGADLDGVEVWVRADVPPDFFCVVDAVGFDQKIDVVLKFGVAGKGIGDAGAWEVFKDFGAIAFVAGVEAEPEG